MTTPRPTTHHGAGRGPTLAVNHVVTAATAEALALGHPEVDVDHLLVGLLVAGGPGGRALAVQGGDLQAVRRAVREEQEERLHTLGVVVETERPVLRAADRTAARPLPVNGRAAALLADLPVGGDDRALLRAMVDDEGGRTAALLERAGTDPAALARRLAEQPQAGPTPPPGTLPAGAGAMDAAALGGAPPAGATWMEVSHEQSVPVAPDRLWALLDDPRRRTEWDATATSVTVVSARSLTVHHERRASTHTLVRREPADAIAWSRHDGEGSSTDQVLQVVLRPEGTGTRVRVERAWLNRIPARGARWRLAKPLLTAMARLQVRSQVHQIAQAA